MPAEIIKISGLNGEWVEVNLCYDYNADKCRCPVCGKLGIPWAGWFNCESQNHKSLVSEGRTFVRLAGSVSN